MGAENTLHCQRLSQVPRFRRGAMRIDVIDILFRQTGIIQRLLHRCGSTASILWG